MYLNIFLRLKTVIKDTISEADKTNLDNLGEYVNEVSESVGLARDQLDDISSSVRALEKTVSDHISKNDHSLRNAHTEQPRVISF